LQPEEVDQVLVDLLSGAKEQAAVSAALREAEQSYRKALAGAENHLEKARASFAKPAHLAVVKIA
jgi:hypothetical protein